MYILEGVPCGDMEIPGEIAKLIRNVYVLLRAAIPVLLVIFGILDLGKAIASQKEDDIKKGQQTFLKRLMAAVIVFFVFIITQFVIKTLGHDGDDFWSCAKNILEKDSGTGGGNKDDI